MTLLPLTNDQRARLQRLNQQKEVVFALKILFLSACVSNPPSNEAIKKITDAFHDLSVIQPNDQAGIKEDNLI